MPTKVYLDTYVLRGLVSSKKPERSEALGEISKLANASFETVMPQIVLGEALATIIRDYSDPNDAHATIKHLYDKIMQIHVPDRGFPVITMKILGEAKLLKDRDEHLSDTDAIIVAQSLLDPDSQRLLTADRKMLDSDVIVDEEKHLRDSGSRRVQLRIVDGL